MKILSPKKLEDHLGYWLRCLSNFIHHSFEERLMQQGVSVAQWVVLRTLYDYDALTLQEGAARVGVDKSSFSRMIERLVQKGLVSRKEGEDRRSLCLKLTREGRALVPVLAELADENDKSFFNILSSQEQTRLKETLHHLLEAKGWSLEKRGKDRMI